MAGEVVLTFLAPDVDGHDGGRDKGRGAALMAARSLDRGADSRGR
jgi:hypothetical protein